MRILLISPGKEPVSTNIDGSLSSMQAAVGGLIQAVYPFDEPVALICNEDGKLLGLTPNRALRHPDTGEIYDIVCGDFFLCSAPPGSDHFHDLSREQFERYTAYFECPEFFPGISSYREVLE